MIFEMNMDSATTTANVNFYSIGAEWEPIGLQAPLSSNYIYVLGELGIVQMQIFKTSAAAWYQYDASGESLTNIDMAYSSSDNTMHILQERGSDATFQLSVQKFDLGLFNTNQSLQSQLDLSGTLTSSSSQNSFISVMLQADDPGRNLMTICAQDVS